jgi:hypothetical protein
MLMCSALRSHAVQAHCRHFQLRTLGERRRHAGPARGAHRIERRAALAAPRHKRVRVLTAHIVNSALHCILALVSLPFTQEFACSRLTHSARTLHPTAFTMHSSAFFSPWWRCDGDGLCARTCLLHRFTLDHTAGGVWVGHPTRNGIKDRFVCEIRYETRRNSFIAVIKVTRLSYPRLHAACRQQLLSPNANRTPCSLFT